MTAGRRGRVERLRGFARGMTGASSTALLAILASHLDAVREGLRLAGAAVSGHEEAATAAIEAVEHRGDELRQDLVTALADCLIPPLDREDVFRLSRAIDDVLDNTRDFAREWALYRPDGERNLALLLQVLGAGSEDLSLAVRAVAHDPDGATLHLLAAKQRANEVRRRFETEVAALLEGEVTAEVLKHRELLRRLDVVGIRLGEAVDILFDALVKRGSGLTGRPQARAR